MSLETDEKGVVATCPKCGQRNRVKFERLGDTPRCAKCATQLRVPAEPVEVGSDRAFDALTSRSPLPVLVDFWAPWCGPCRMVAPQLNKVAEEDAGRLVIAKVNTEAVPALAQKFRIHAIPTMAIFKNGIEVARQAGAMAAPAIRQFVAPFLKNGKA